MSRACGAELRTLVCWAGPASAWTSATFLERWPFLFCLSGLVTPSPLWSLLTRWQASVHEVDRGFQTRTGPCPRMLRGAGFPSWCAGGRDAGAGASLSPPSPQPRELARLPGLFLSLCLLQALLFLPDARLVPGLSGGMEPRKAVETALEGASAPVAPRQYGQHPVTQGGCTICLL